MEVCTVLYPSLTNVKVKFENKHIVQHNTYTMHNKYGFVLLLLFFFFFFFFLISSFTPSSASCHHHYPICHHFVIQSSSNDPPHHILPVSHFLLAYCPSHKCPSNPRTTCMIRFPHSAALDQNPQITVSSSI